MRCGRADAGLLEEGEQLGPGVERQLDVGDGGDGTGSRVADKRPVKSS